MTTAKMILLLLLAALSSYSTLVLAGGDDGGTYDEIYKCSDRNLSFQVWEKQETGSRYVWIIDFQNHSYAGGNYDSFADYSYSDVVELASLRPFDARFGSAKIALDQAALTAIVNAPGIDSSLVDYAVTCKKTK